MYAFLEFRGKVNSRTQCVCIFRGRPPPPPPPTPPTPLARMSSRPRRWRQGFDGVHRDGLVLATARYCPRPPSASRETSDDVSVLSSRSIKAPSVHCCGGLPSLYSRLSPPLGVSLAGGVLTHLSMAAWHPLRGEAGGRATGLGKLLGAPFLPRLFQSTGRGKRGVRRGTGVWE
jgi:hypothetical protein